MPAQSHSIFTDSFTASGAITAYRAVGFDGAEATAQGQKVAGVARTKAADGEQVAVDMIGTTIVEAGAAISAGDSLIVDSSGRAMPSTGEISIASGATQVTSTAANGAILTGGELPEYIFADARADASAAGDLIEVALRR